MGNRYKVAPYTPGSVNEGGMWGIPFEGMPEVGSVELGKGGVGHTYFERPPPPPPPASVPLQDNSFVGDKFPTIWIAMVGGKPVVKMALEESAQPVSGSVTFRAGFEYVNTAPRVSRRVVEQSVVDYLLPLLESTYTMVRRGTPIAQSESARGAVYPTLYVAPSGRSVAVSLVDEKAPQKSTGVVSFDISLDFTVADERIDIEQAKELAADYMRGMLLEQFNYSPGHGHALAPVMDSTQPVGSVNNPVLVRDEGPGHFNV